ncbi:MAG: site-specific DNA-methyltransferase [Prevotellaceae bacterium]|jgi:site-specific DNA-methyltransferase (adenine-specific)|nr:site-specific DNA-methyltransferase [Prevotellaceae bacterium]
MFNLTENTDKNLNKIINGNCKDVLANFDGNSVDLVVTSPPYDDLRDYTNNESWNFKLFQEIAKQLFRVMKVGGVVVWVVGDKVTNGNKSLTSYRQALYFQEIGFNIFDVIIYEKTGSGPPHKNRYFNIYEYMFVLSKGLPKTINLLKDKVNKWANCQTYGNVTRREKDGSLTDKGRKTVNDYGVRTNIWKYTNGKGFSTKDEIAYQHPAIFPEKLVRDHILSWSNEGDVVLDPFGGSGTVAKVAIQLKRKWISIEISKEYCELAEKRIKPVLCNTALL